MRCWVVFDVRVLFGMFSGGRVASLVDTSRVGGIAIMYWVTCLCVFPSFRWAARAVLTHRSHHHRTEGLLCRSLVNVMLRQ